MPVRSASSAEARDCRSVNMPPITQSHPMQGGTISVSTYGSQFVPRRAVECPGWAALPAARDVQDRPCDVRGGIAQQPHDRLGDFLGPAGPSERRGAPQLARAVRIAGGRMDLRLDEAGPDGVDAYALAPELLRKPYRQRVECGLGACVI